MLSAAAQPTWHGLRADAWSAIGTWIYVGITLGLLIYAAVQFELARRVRNDETRPFVIVDFHFKSIMVSLSVKNIGRTAALHVHVSLDQLPTSAVMNPIKWTETPPFTGCVPLFAPGREMRFALDTFPTRRDANLPQIITGTIEYRHPHRKRRQFKEPFTIDMSGFGESLMPPKDISDVADALERIRKKYAPG